MSTIFQVYDVDDVLHVKIRKDDGGWHRCCVAPGDDADRIMERVNAHLERMGHGRVSGAEVAELKTRVAQEHTPEKIAVHRARQT